MPTPFILWLIVIMGGVPYATPVQESFASKSACEAHIEKHASDIIKKRKQRYPAGAIQHWQLECQWKDAGKTWEQGV